MTELWTPYKIGGQYSVSDGLVVANLANQTYIRVKSQIALLSHLMKSRV